MSTSLESYVTDLFRGMLSLTGYDVQKALYLYRNESLDDLNFIGTKFSKEISDYRMNMAKLGSLH